MMYVEEVCRRGNFCMMYVEEVCRRGNFCMTQLALKAYVHKVILFMFLNPAIKFM